MELINRFCDIDVFPEMNLIYSGFVIRQTRSVLVMVSFNNYTKRFDGFTIFRTRDIAAYRFWTRKEIQEIKRDNRREVMATTNLIRANTFYSCLKVLSNAELVAMCPQSNDFGFYVGAVTKLTRSSVRVQLMSKEGEWLGRRTFKLAELSWISFRTTYEKRLVRMNRAFKAQVKKSD